MARSSAARTALPSRVLPSCATASSLLPGQRVAWEAATGVKFVDQNAGLDGGVLLHQCVHLLARRVEDADAGNVAAVSNRAHDREKTLGAQGEVPASVLPNRGLVPRISRLWAGFQD